MENMPENNFFQVTLSQQGANWLLRVSRITSWLFVLGSITCLLHLASTFIRYFKFGEFPDDGSCKMIFQIYVVPVFDVFFVVLTFIQLYYFYKFARLCKKAIGLQQADLFNESFQSLLKNTLLAAVMFVLQFVFGCLIIHWQFLI